MLEINLFWTIITIMSVVIEWAVLKVVLNELNKSRKSKLALNSGLLVAVSTITILTLINFNPNIKLFICIIMTYLFCRFNYDVDKLKGVLISLLYWMIVIGFDFLGLSIIGVLNSIKDMNELLSSSLVRLELIILSKSLLSLLIPLIKVIKLKIEINKRDCIYITIPILANIISIITIFSLIFKDKKTDSLESILIFIVSFILILSNISLVSIIIRIIKDNKLKLENKIIKEKIDMQYKYYLNLKESQSKTRKLYHDMNNHMMCIQSIYGKNNIADNYIDNIKKKLKDCDSIFNTKNVILDIILNEKKLVCDTKNIEFIADINFSKCNFIDMPDICSIFSNMIDNSIEACNKIDGENRRIKLRGTVINTFFVIKCENTKINNIVLKNDKLMTDKIDSFLHGIGISSIKSSVEKYNGNIEIDSTENKFRITIFIPLIKNYDQLCI